MTLDEVAVGAEETVLLFGKTLVPNRSINVNVGTDLPSMLTTTTVNVIELKKLRLRLAAAGTSVAEGVENLLPQAMLMRFFTFAIARLPRPVVWAVFNAKCCARLTPA